MEGMRMAEVREQLQAALSSFCGQATEEFLQSAESADFEAIISHVAVFSSIRSDIRTKILHLLGRWSDPRAVEELIGLLPSLEGTDLLNAIDALARKKTSAAHAAIAQYQEHQDAEVRRAVARALAKIGSASALIELRELAAAEPVSYVQRYAESLLEARDDRT
jgi:HEAT repeat protein